VDNDHTGEEVVAAAMGPGAERISGFFPNTAVFDVVMAAYGWSEAAPSLAP
jgi:alkaline phosphatase